MKKIWAGFLSILLLSTAQAGLHGNFELQGEPMSFMSITRENPPSDGQKDSLKGLMSQWHMSSYDPKAMPDKTREEYEALTVAQFENSWKTFQDGDTQLYVIAHATASDDNNWQNSLKGGGFYVTMEDTLFIRSSGFELRHTRELLSEVFRTFATLKNFPAGKRMTFFLNAQKPALHEMMIRMGCQRSDFSHVDFDPLKYTAFERPMGDAERLDV